MTDKTKISVTGLYKIFGDNAERMVDVVKTGVDKRQLLADHNHVLGLKDINLQIEANHLHVVMGLSGSGKSTLIRHLNRLIDPTAGEILVDGSNIMTMTPIELQDYRRHKISMVFQRFGLLPHRTVFENVAYGLAIQKLARPEIKERTMRWIDRVGLAGYETYYPTQLSGGMQQRVGLARALATDAEILLMDEAFSALDPLIRTDMQAMLLDLQAELHKTIVFITHDLDEALRIGDQITILRDGMVIQNGGPQDIVMNPADDYITDFIRDINRGRVVHVEKIMNEQIADLHGKGIPARMTLEDALPLVTDSSDHCLPVVDDAGKVIGSVTVASVAHAMARPENASSERIQ